MHSTNPETYCVHNVRIGLEWINIMDLSRGGLSAAYLRLVVHKTYVITFCIESSRPELNQTQALYPKCISRQLFHFVYEILTCWGVEGISAVAKAPFRLVLMVLMICSRHVIIAMPAVRLRII